MKIPLTVFAIIGVLCTIYYLYYMRVSYFDGTWLATPKFIEEVKIDNIACDLNKGKATFVLKDGNNLDVQYFKYTINPFSNTITFTPNTATDKLFDGEYNYLYAKDLERLIIMRDKTIAMDIIMTDEISSESD